MSWEIVLGLSALVGFFITCATPMIKLNTSITKLNETIGSLKDIVDKNDETNKQSHQRIYDRLDAHDSTIHSHNERISNIEQAAERRMEQLKDVEKETMLQGQKIVRIEENMDHMAKQVTKNETRIENLHNNK